MDTPTAVAAGTGTSSFRDLCGRLERGIALMTEIPGAILVVVEVVVLFAGVTFRYGLHRPLVWSDELASMLFLWLCMLGAVVAQHKGGHMRLTVIAALVREPWKSRIETLSSSCVIVFLVLILHPAWEHANDQMLITTPALQLPDAIRSAAILTGTVLMLAIALLQLLQRAKPLDLLYSFGVIVVCGGLLQFFLPQLENIENWNLLVFFGIGVTALVLGGAPIAFAFGLSTVVYLMFMTQMPMSIVISRMDEGMSTFVLLSIPLFVLLGLLIEMTGLAAVLVNLLASLVGHFKGGLSYVLVGAMYLVSGISGSKAADMAAIAPVLLPEMQRRGKEPGELIGLLSSSAAMAETIPPSIVLITVGSVTGVSIAALFTGGLLPAAVGAVALVIVAWFRSRGEDVSGAVRASRRQIMWAFVASVPALLLLVLIRWAVVSGGRDRDGGIDHRHRLHGRGGDRDLSPLPARAGVADVVRNAGLVGRDHDHPRHRHRHGLGADAVGLLPAARPHHGADAGRARRLPGVVDPGVRYPRQCARGHPGHRGVRAASLPHRSRPRYRRRALRHHDGALHEPRPVHAAPRYRLLPGLRHRPRRSRQGHAGDLALHGGAPDRGDHRRGFSLADAPGVVAS